jgi:hypothetical protein
MLVTIVTMIDQHKLENYVSYFVGALSSDLVEVNETKQKVEQYKIEKAIEDSKRLIQEL